MRRNKFKNILLQKQTMIILTVVAVAAILMTGIYVSDQKKNNRDGESAYLEETEAEQSEPVSKVIEPKEKTEQTENVDQGTEKETVQVAEIAQPAEQPEEQPAAEEQPATEQTKKASSSAVKTSGQTADNLHFSQESELLWPLNGSVIMSYHMDQTVYFATLQQYKYNPAIIISGALDEEVLCAADGVVADVFENEETGCTVVMDIGDGYQATYGQLSQVPYEKGAYVAMGQTIGHVAEPTKYYSVEGNNLYFKLEKDGNPVDPVLFFE